MGSKVTYEFDILPTEEQRTKILKNIAGYRMVYNFFLGERKGRFHADGSYYGKFSCMHDLGKLKDENLWLKDLDSQALVCAIYDLDVTFNYFFSRVTKGQKMFGPKFIRRNEYPKYYRTRSPNSSIYLRGDTIRLPKLGRVLHSYEYEINQKISSVFVFANGNGTFSVRVHCNEE